MALAALLPVLYLGVRAGEGGWDQVVETVFDATTARLLLRSLGLAIAVTVASAVIAVALAWLTVRCDLPGRGFWRVVAALPLAVPTYVGGFAFVSLGPSWTGFKGAWLVLTLLSYPYVFLPVAAALERTDPSIEEAARSLGNGAFASFVRVSLPQLRPALATGSLLVGLYVLSDFGAVSIMRFDSFTRVIYQSYRASFDRTPAVILGCLLLLVTAAILVFEAASRGRGRYNAGGRAAPRARPAISLGRLRWPAVLVPVIVAIGALGIPAATLLHWALDSSAGTVDVGRVLRAARGSVSASGAGALVTVIAALPVAFLAARYRGRLAAVVERSAYVGHALPGIVVALSLVFFSARYTTSLYQRLPVLVFAYVVLFLPLAVSAVYSSALQAPVALEEAARSLGRGPMTVAARITAPLVAPGLGAGAAMVLLTCMKELPATLLLAPTGFDTLATRVWSATSAGAFGEAALPAALLVVVASLPTWALARRWGGAKDS